MVLLILPALWAAVLLPYWVRYVRERRAEGPVAAFTRQSSSRQRGAAVRYVFGAYDPYRDGLILRDANALETDISYLPAKYRQAAWRQTYAQGFSDDTYFDEPATYDDAYSDELDDEHYGDDLSNVQALPPSGPASPRRGVHPTRNNGNVRVVTGSRTVGGVWMSSSRLALRRRRQIFFTLVVGFLASLGAAAWFGSAVAWGVHAGVIMLLASYVTLLVRHHQRMVDRSTKVRRLAPAPGRGVTRRPAVVVLSGGTAR